MPSGIWIRLGVIWLIQFSGTACDDVRLMIRHKSKSALEILESPDELKFWSCLTLIYEAASDKSDHSLFAEALEQFYNGKPDPRTLELLRSE